MERKTKIYLSKSKVGNPDDLMNVRHHLAKLDCMVVEFIGGVYDTSHKDVIDCDILLIIPPNLSIGRVGKGQYSEIDAFSNNVFEDNAKTIFIVDYVDSKGIQFRELRTYYESAKKDWSNDYGVIESKNPIVSLSAFAGHHLINLNKPTSIASLDDDIDTGRDGEWAKGVESPSFTGSKHLLTLYKP